MELKGKNLILTGATGGIGGEIARGFAKKGTNLALVGRNSEKLARIAEACRDLGVNTIAIIADVSRSEDVERIVKECGSRLGEPDILVNNAGVMCFKPVKGYSGSEIEDLVMTNIAGPILLTQAVLPGMIKRGSGRIVNIGSIFGSLAFPYFAVYSAGKSAIRGFSEALRRELHGSGVGVTYVAPRGTRTSQSKGFFEMAERVGMNMDMPEKVAEIVVDAVEKNRKEVYIGGPERFFVLLNKFAPSIIDKALSKKVPVMEEYSVRGDI